MKILFVHTPPDLYGASRSLLRLTSRLVKDGNEVSVITDMDGQLCWQLRGNGISVHIVKDLFVVNRDKFKNPARLIKMFLFFPVALFRLHNVIREIKTDIIHTNNALIVAPAVYAYFSRIKHIWHIRESFSEYGPLWNIYQKLIVRMSKKVIAVSSPVASQFNNVNKNDKIIVLHNGFPAGEFENISAERIERFKEAFSLKEKTLVGVVGRIKYQRKGQEVFIKAASLLAQKNINAHYVIIGSPFPGNEDHLRSLEDLIKELQLNEYVTITGDVEDIKAAMSALDISVLPSGLPEPFSGVVIESMALGKPVIGTNIGGTTEQIENGVTGLLVPPNDHIALADAIEKLLKDNRLRLAMGSNAREKFLNKFEFESYYVEIKKLYLSVQNC